MANDPLLPALQGIFRDVLDVDDLVLSPEMTPADIPGWDSIHNVNILVAAESEFGVKFGVEDMQRIKKVGDIVELVRSRRAG